MKNQQQFENSVNVLAKAYREGTLVHGNPCGCAVGNLVADGCGYEMRIRQRYSSEGSFRDIGWKHQSPEWYWAVTRMAGLVDAEATLQVKATGYTIEQLSRIEAAFENRDANGYVGETLGYSTDPYEGLCRVYDALCDIHEVPVVDRVAYNVTFCKEEKPEYKNMMVEVV